MKVQRRGTNQKIERNLAIHFYLMSLGQTSSEAYAAVLKMTLREKEDAMKEIADLGKGQVSKLN